MDHQVALRSIRKFGAYHVSGKLVTSLGISGVMGRYNLGYHPGMHFFPLYFSSADRLFWFLGLVFQLIIRL
jgi:hypothetical protein